MAPADGLARFTSAMIRTGPPPGERPASNGRGGGASAARARSSRSGSAARRSSTSVRLRARIGSRKELMRGAW